MTTTNQTRFIFIPRDNDDKLPEPRDERHEWSDNDMIVCFYYTKFGFKNLPVNSVEGLSELMGVKQSTLVMNKANFRMLMRCTDNYLTDYKNRQELIYELFNGVSFYEFYSIVRDILHTDFIERITKLKRLGYVPQRMRMI